jgi:hypothetical protein
LNPGKAIAEIKKKVMERRGSRWQE